VPPPIRHTSLVTRDEIERLRALLSPTFINELDEVLYRFGVSLGFQRLAEISAQFYASWIDWRGLWADARDRYWEDYLGARRYERREDAPKDRQDKLIYKDYQRWRSFQAFIDWTCENLPIGKTTFWMRNRQIKIELQLWVREHQTDDIPIEDFLRIVEGVCINKAVGWQITAALMVVEKENRGASPVITGVNHENVNRVAESMGVGMPDEQDTAEYEAAAAGVAAQYIQDQRTRIADGEAARVVLRETRRHLRTYRKCEVRRSGGDLYLEYRQPIEDDDLIDFDIDPPETYAIKFLDRDGNMLKVDELPITVQEWLHNRLVFTAIS